MIINKIKKFLFIKSDYQYVFFNQIIVSGSNFLISILVLYGKLSGQLLCTKYRDPKETL